MPNVPLHETANTLTCGYGPAGGPMCGAVPVWHLSWFDPDLPAAEWENSLACQEHRDTAQARGWEIGWRHHVNPACCMPGALLRIADEGDDEDGFPITFCYHPWDIDGALAEAVEPLVHVVSTLTGREPTNG